MRTLRCYLPTIMGLLCVASPLWATPIINVGNFNLLANKPNQTITLAVTGGDAVSGFNLRAVIGDGSGAGVEPKFTANDYATNTIWVGHGATPVGGPIPGLASDNQGSITLNTAGDTVNATGNVVNLTIDTTGITTAGVYPLSLSNTEIGLPSRFFVTGGTEIPTTITNGTITIVVPEPASMSFLLVGGLCFLRRKR